MGLCRGDIALVDFNPAKGGEIGKLRPALILSQKDEVEILDTVVVLPLSTLIEDGSRPYRYLVKKREKLLKDSDICVYEIRALSKKRVKERVATLTSDEFKDVQNYLFELFG